jgi:pyruvate carboxylase
MHATSKSIHGCGSIRHLLVANRSEIAIRIFRAATELRIRTFAAYAEQDKLSLSDARSDEDGNRAARGT